MLSRREGTPILALLLALLAPAHAAADAETLLRQGRIAEAVVAATEAARRAPSDLDAQELYIDVLHLVGLASRAVTEMRARQAAAPTDPDALYLVGRAEPDAAQSRGAYEAALRIDPDHARAHMGLGAVNEGTGNLTAAVAGYTRAVELDASLSEAWIGRMRTLLVLGREKEALEVARAGWRVVPTEPGLALAIAHLDPPSAQQVLEDAAGRVPGDPRVFEALAALALDVGDAETALLRSEQALAIDPALTDASRTRLVAREIRTGRLDRNAWVHLADLRRLEATDPSAALAGYPPLVEAWPRSALVLLGRVSARTSAGRPPEEALADARAAARADPDNVEAAAVAGLALLRVGRAAEAEPLLARASRARPWDASLGLARARALQQLGRQGEASALLASIADAHRLDADVQLAYTDDLVRAGKLELAYVRLKECLLLVPDPRLAAAFIRVAPAAGHPEEAAILLDQIVAQTGNAQLADEAKRLREQGSPR
jgi:tetratricopeptide (TPR) repeat protein